MQTYTTKPQDILDYEEELRRQERAPATISKYKHDLGYFFSWLEKREERKIKE